MTTHATTRTHGVRRVRSARRILLALVLGAPLAGAMGAAGAHATRADASAVVGPPWISIEHPANPWDRTTRDAYLLVHAYHHGTPVGFPVSGTAEGLVNGERRSIALELTATSRSGVYALRRQWPTQGIWTLVITVTQARDDVASAVVEIAPTGEVAAALVPTTGSGDRTIPRGVTRAEVESSLRARAARLARAG